MISRFGVCHGFCLVTASNHLQCTKKKGYSYSRESDTVSMHVSMQREHWFSETSYALTLLTKYHLHPISN